METNIIDFLEEKDFSADEIYVMQQKLIKLPGESKELLQKFNVIYKVFSFAHLPDLTINKLIVNNPGLLTKTDLELIKIAFVWFETGLFSEGAQRNRGIYINNINRTYLRNLYLNSGINYLKSPISYHALLLGDREFSTDHQGTINGIIFYPNMENLVLIYGKGDTAEEKSEFINKNISINSLKWYVSNLKKIREKANGNRSISV